MDIPTDGDGRFEAVDLTGAVVAVGTVEDAGEAFPPLVTFDILGPNATPVALVMPEFEANWAAVPMTRNLELRAYTGPHPGEH